MRRDCRHDVWCIVSVTIAGGPPRGMKTLIIVVIGVAGSGKTTIGTMLAAAMKCPFLEGDSLHPKENIDKMSHGIPLTDSDRGPWLSAIHGRMLDYFARGQDLIVGCSALKQSYRQVLAKGIPIIWDKLGHIDSAVHLPTRSDLCSSVDRCVSN